MHAGTFGVNSTHTCSTERRTVQVRSRGSGKRWPQTVIGVSKCTVQYGNKQKCKQTKQIKKKQMQTNKAKGNNNNKNKCKQTK